DQGEDPAARFRVGVERHVEKDVSRRLLVPPGSNPLLRHFQAHRFGCMDQERHETYERIPWEALDAKRPDPNRLVIIVAVAIALGALAFSFMRNQPAPPPATIAAEVAASLTTVPVVEDAATSATLVRSE